LAGVGNRESLRPPLNRFALCGKRLAEKFSVPSEGVSIA
jgi:hypothetical protein